MDDPVHHRIVCDEGDDAHPALASRTGHGVDFENLADLMGLYFIGQIPSHAIVLNLFGNNNLLDVFDQVTTVP